MNNAGLFTPIAADNEWPPRPASSPLLDDTILSRFARRFFLAAKVENAAGSDPGLKPATSYERIVIGNVGDARPRLGQFFNMSTGTEVPLWALDEGMMQGALSHNPAVTATSTTHTRIGGRSSVDQLSLHGDITLAFLSGMLAIGAGITIGTALNTLSQTADITHATKIRLRKETLDARMVPLAAASIVDAAKAVGATHYVASVSYGQTADLNLSFEHMAAKTLAEIGFDGHGQISLAIFTVKAGVGATVGTQLTVERSKLNVTARSSLLGTKPFLRGVQGLGLTDWDAVVYRRDPEAQAILEQADEYFQNLVEAVGEEAAKKTPDAVVTYELSPIAELEASFDAHRRPSDRKPPPPPQPQLSARLKLVLAKTWCAYLDAVAAREALAKAPQAAVCVAPAVAAVRAEASAALDNIHEGFLLEVAALSKLAQAAAAAAAEATAAATGVAPRPEVTADASKLQLLLVEATALREHLRMLLTQALRLDRLQHELRTAGVVLLPAEQAVTDFVTDAAFDPRRRHAIVYVDWVALATDASDNPSRELLAQALLPSREHRDTRYAAADMAWAPGDKLPSLQYVTPHGGLRDASLPSLPPTRSPQRYLRDIRVVFTPGVLGIGDSGEAKDDTASFAPRGALRPNGLHGVDSLGETERRDDTKNHPMNLCTWFVPRYTRDASQAATQVVLEEGEEDQTKAFDVMDDRSPITRTVSLRFTDAAGAPPGGRVVTRVQLLVTPRHSSSPKPYSSGSVTLVPVRRVVRTHDLVLCVEHAAR